MYALVRTGGRQYKVSPGDLLTVDRIQGEPSSALIFDEVLLVEDGDEIRVGAPTVPGAAVSCTILEHVRGPKIRIFKYRAKKRYRRRMGHRSALTVLRVDAVAGVGVQPAVVALAKPAPKGRARPAAKPASKAKAAAKLAPKTRTKSAPKAKAAAKAAAKPAPKARAKATAKAAAKAPAKAKAAPKTKAKPAAKGKSSTKSGRSSKQR